LVIAWEVFDPSSTPAATLTACLGLPRAARAAALVSFFPSVGVALTVPFAAVPKAPACVAALTAAPRLPRRRLPRGGHLLTLPLFSFSLREAGRERSLHCRWLAQCSDRGGRLLGLHSHPSRREGTRRRNHDRHSPRGRVEGGGDSVAAEGRRLPRHPAQCHSPPTACAVEPGRACRRRRRQCTVVHTVGDGCWHLYWAGDVAVGDGSAVACFCCWTGCSGLRRCCFRRWWCEAASSSEAGFNVVHGISLVLFLFFAVAQR